MSSTIEYTLTREDLEAFFAYHAEHAPYVVERNRRRRWIWAGIFAVLIAVNDRSFDWDADYLYFSVRQPWPSKTSGAEITFGMVTQTNPLIVVSHMPEHGVIFSDGIEADYLQFNSGTEATICLAGRKGHLVV
jgi:hypothetical protein